MADPFSFAARVISFRHAFAGVATLLREQHNARIHLVASLLVVALASVRDVDRVDWLILLLTMALVWLAEGLNSALEYLSDAAVPEQHPLIAKAKDVGAASVLIVSGFAVVIAALVFVPYF